MADVGRGGILDPISMTTPTLFCAECGCSATVRASHWKAEIGDDPRDDDPPEVVMFCPELLGA